MNFRDDDDTGDDTDLISQCMQCPPASLTLKWLSPLNSSYDDHDDSNHDDLFLTEWRWMHVYSWQLQKSKKIIISCVRFYFEIFDKNLHLKNRTNKSCICHLMLQLAHYHINLSCISWMVDFSKMMTWPDVTVLNREINIRPCQVSYMIKSID